MPSKALSIVEEFAISNSPIARSKSAPALAALKTQESIVRLTNIALSDPDIAVRKCAEAEVLALEHAALGFAIQELKQTVETDVTPPQKKRRAAAYGLLGRLRAKGRDVRCPSIPFFSRLRLAFAMSSYLYSPRKIRFRVRAWKWGLLGGLIGLCCFMVPALFAMCATMGTLVYLGVASFAMVASLLASIISTQFTAPIQVQLDKFAGSLVEILTPTFLSFVVNFHTFIVLTWYFREWDKLIANIFILFALSIMVGLTRAGTILGYGIFRHKSLNKLTQMIVGTIFFIFAASLSFYFLFWKELVYKYTVWGVKEKTLAQFFLWLVAPLNEERWTFWLILLPVGAGLAFTYVSIDSDSKESPTTLFFLSKPLTYLLVACFFLLLSLTLLIGFQERKMIIVSPENVHKMEFSPDNKFLAAAQSNGIVIWDLATHKIYNKIPWDYVSRDDAHWQNRGNAILSKLAFSPNGQKLALLDDIGRLFIWDIKGQKLLVKNGGVVSYDKNQNEVNKQTISEYPTDQIKSFTFSTDNNRLVLGDAIGNITIIDTNIWKVLDSKATVPRSSKHNQIDRKEEGVAIGQSSAGAYDTSTARAILGIAFLGGGKHLITLSNNAVKLWDYSSLHPVRTLFTVREFVDTLAVSADEKWIAIYTDRKYNKDIWLWHTERPQDQPISLTPFSSSSSFSLDGKLLAERDWGINLYDIPLKKSLVTLHTYGNSVGQLDFSHDGKWLAAEMSGGIRLWETSQWTKP